MKKYTFPIIIVLILIAAYLLKKYEIDATDKQAQINNASIEADLTPNTEQTPVTSSQPQSNVKGSSTSQPTQTNEASQNTSNENCDITGTYGGGDYIRFYNKNGNSYKFNTNLGINGGSGTATVSGDQILINSNDFDNADITLIDCYEITGTVHESKYDRTVTFRSLKKQDN